MRPVDLTPAGERRGGQAPLRSGPLAYLVVAALVGALVGVTALVLAGNQVSDRKAELSQLRREDQAAQAKAQRLASYTQFASLTEQRVATVTSLADSRFDWERVMRELSLVLPEDVWLVDLNASAAADVSTGGGEGSAGSGLRSAAPGPALEMSGCAAGHEAVAEFVTALKDIEGVTRVGIQSSELAEESAAGAAAAGSGEAAASGGNEDCRTRSFITKFEIVAAFDAAPVPPSTSGEAPVAPAEPEATTTSTEETGEG
ncbi:MAG TPA: PilN domain-containing protein [Solirubrobacterales bacterium]|nr:PilN domain-containing protein [Solirubrobacterales bacterium]